MNEQQQKCVAHINQAFIVKSETFIYNYVSHLVRYKPIFCANEFINLDLFPLSIEDIYPISTKLFSLRYLKEKVLRKLFKMDITFENICRDRSVSLIHAHFGPNGVNALNTCRRLNIPLITNFYGYDLFGLAQDPQWCEQYQKLFQEGDLFLVEGPYMKAQLAALGCPVEKIKIQRIAIRLDEMSFQERIPKKEGQKVRFVFCGRFVEKKGLLVAIEALHEVLKHNQMFEFHIIGEGPLKEDVIQMIKQYRMEARVKLLGFLSYQDYLKEMEAADIFLHPSLTAANKDSEGGAPTTILEAQAIGLPIISTTHADIPNVVQQDKSALLSSEGDIYELAKNILALMKHQDRWAEMGNAGRDFVEKNHNINNEIHLLEEKYDELTQKNN